MNPLNILRWKMLLVLGVVGFGLYFVEQRFPTVVPNQIQNALEKGLAKQFDSTANIDRVEFDIKNGRLKVFGVRVDDPIDPSKWLFQIDEVDMKIDPSMLPYRKLVADHIDLKHPQAAIERKPEDGGKPAGEWDEEVLRRAREIYDKVGKARDFYEKWKETVAKIRAKKKMMEEKKDALEKDEGATDMPELGARLVVKRMSVEGIDIEFKDDQALPKLFGGSLVGTDISNSPARHSAPMNFVISTRFDDALSGPLLKLQAGLKPDGRMLWAGLMDQVPVSRIEPFVRESLPVKLLGGKMSVAWNGWFEGLDRLDLSPTLIFEDLKLQAKPEFAQIAGFAAPLLAQEFTAAGKFALADIRIHGDLMNPSVDLGDTVPTLMKMGGKLFAEKLGAALADHLLGQLHGLIPGGEQALGIPGALLGSIVGGGDPAKALEQALSQNLVGVIGQISGGGKGDPTGRFGGILKDMAGSGGLEGVLKGTGAQGAPGANPINDLMGTVLGGAKSGDPAKPAPPNPLDLLKGVKPPPGEPKKDAPKPNPTDLLKGVLGGSKPVDPAKPAPTSKPTSKPTEKPAAAKPEDALKNLLGGALKKTVEKPEEKKKD